MKVFFTSWVLALLLFQIKVPGQSVSSPTVDNSVASELKSFEIAEGYAVNLFADETDGIANPIAIRWDARGRLWVLCTLVYPQVVPREKADDKIFILEDVDRDGHVDKTTIFVDGLDMPTGFALGDGGVYVGEGQNLIFLRDRDGDDRADYREEVFSGFGTGDTHQNINSFTWSPDGELLFGQGLHCFSRVETPWGIVRLNEHGIWRMRPRRKQLHAFRGGSGQNPWGIGFGQWGEPFVKGNNSELSELLPVMVATEKIHRPLNIGATRIKSMICEVVDSPALPEDLQGDILIAGYFGHLVDRLDMSVDGAGHKGVLEPPLIRTGHNSFRPVDIRTGPDGALYVADWYNPIIGHYQASLRHPDRDKEHGRIWRVVAKGKKPQPIQDLTRASIAQLLARLQSAFLSERGRVREELSSRKTREVVAGLDIWIKGKLSEHDLFEALSLYAWHESINEKLLHRLLEAEHPRARAFATRIVGRWHDRIDNPLSRLRASVQDEDARVRLEAVVAAGYVSDPGAMAVAARAMDKPVDRFIQAALIQTAHATKNRWWPALQKGRSDFAEPEHLAFALKQTGGQDAAHTVRGLLGQGDLESSAVENLMSLLVEIGTPQDLRWVLDRAEGKPAALEALIEAARIRGLKPLGDPKPSLIPLMASKNQKVQSLAVRLVGVWNVAALADELKSVGKRDSTPVPIRSAAIESLGDVLGRQAWDDILVAADATAPELRQAAWRTLCAVDLSGAAQAANVLLRKKVDAQTVQDIVTPFLGYKEGPGALSIRLGQEPIPPGLALRIRGVIGAAGRFDPGLDGILRTAEAKNKVGLPVYSESFVQALTKEVKQVGVAANGAGIYASAELSCAACHKINETGGMIGPELTAVGAGVPVELLIEAVLWPRRQIKEGYTATTLATQGGKAIAGYVQSENKQRIVIRDVATGRIQTVATGEVVSRQDAGTLMPPGLTAGLTRSELRDLIRYLSERKGAGEPAK